MIFLLRWSHSESCDDTLSGEALAESGLHPDNIHHDTDPLTREGFPKQEFTVSCERQPGNSAYLQNRSPSYPESLPPPISLGTPDGRTQGARGLDADHHCLPASPLAPARTATRPPQRHLPQTAPHQVAPWPCHLHERVSLSGKMGKEMGWWVAGSAQGSSAPQHPAAPC